MPIVWRIFGLIIALTFSSILSSTSTSREADKSVIHSVSVTAFLSTDGSASIEETWDMTIRDGTENYKQLFGMLNERLDGFSVSENGVPYQPLEPWNVNLPRGQKAGRYGINKTKSGPELCWGIGMENGRHSYTIRYSLRDIVTLHDDQDGSVKAALYWQFISKKFQRAERVDVRVVPPGPIGPDHHFWIFGFNGEVDVRSNNYHIQARNVRVGHFVELALIMPFDDFSNAKRIGYPKLAVIRKNGRSGDDLGRFKAKAPMNADAMEAMGIKPSYVFGFVLIIFYGSAVLLGKVFTPALPIKRHAARSVPPEETLEATAHLLSLLYKTPELLNTFMITWIYKKYIRIEPGSASLFRSGSSDSMIFLDSWPESFDGPYEERFFEVAASSMTKRDGTPAEAYRRYLKNYKTAALQKIDSEFTLASEQYCRDRGWLTQNRLAALFNRREPLWGLMWGLLVGVPAFFSVWALAAVVPCLILFVVLPHLPRFRLNGLTPEGREAIDSVLGFASYLCNYSLLEKRGVEHIELWDSYMAFAHLLGIADKVERELSKLFPSYRIDNRCAAYIHSNVYNASSRSFYSPSPAFGGGSGSSGGGGGGSGGGGGGGTR